MPASNTVSVISPTNTVLTTITGLNLPYGVAVSATGANAGYVYATNSVSDTVAVIDPLFNVVVATINVGNAPNAIAVA